MDDSTLKSQKYASKDKAIYDDNVAYLASIIPFYLSDSSEATDTDSMFSISSDIASTDLSIFDSSEVSNTDPFSNSSDIASSDLSIFDSSSDASSITDSSVFIDCSI